MVGQVLYLRRVEARAKHVLRVLTSKNIINTPEGTEKWGSDEQEIVLCKVVRLTIMQPPQRKKVRPKPNPIEQGWYNQQKTGKYKSSTNHPARMAMKLMQAISRLVVYFKH